MMRAIRPDAGGRTSPKQLGGSLLTYKYLDNVGNFRANLRNLIEAEIKKRLPKSILDSLN